MTYVLRTRAPLVVANPFDLHVLGPPQTFALSQDQTLQFESARQIRRSGNRPCPSGPASGCESLRSSLSHKRSCKTRNGVSLLGLLFLSPVFRERARLGRVRLGHRRRSPPRRPTASRGGGLYFRPSRESRTFSKNSSRVVSRALAALWGPFVGFPGSASTPSAPLDPRFFPLAPSTPGRDLPARRPIGRQDPCPSPRRPRRFLVPSSSFPAARAWRTIASISAITGSLACIR